MKIIIRVFLLCVGVLIAVSFGSGQPPNVLPIFGGCQTYGVKVINKEVKYICESYNEKVGACPKNTSQYKDAMCNLNEVLCMGDWQCPPGFKCCKDEGVQLFHVCKKAIFEKNKTEAAVPPPKKNGGTAAPGTPSGPASPPNAGSGSGSGSGSPPSTPGTGPASNPGMPPLPAIQRSGKLHRPVKD